MTDEEKSKELTRSNFAAQMAMLGYEPDENPKDMVEVVRCKDCVNCIKELNGDLYCDVLAVGYEPLGSKRVTENWYCADGERKE